MKNKLLLEVIGMYLVMAIGGYLSYTLIPVQGDLLRFFIADLVMTLIAYGFSLLKNNSSVYDPYWTVIPFLFLVMWWGLYSSGWGPAEYAAAVVISFWSWRLTHNWYRGFPGWHHEDWRYVNFRKQFGPRFQWVNFSGIHLFPTLIVFLGLSGLFWLYDGRPREINALIVMGCIVALTGTFLELFADNTLFRERRNPERVAGTCIRKGLWRYSRNPNYLGEMMFWIGLAQIGQGAGAPGWTLTGAAAMIMMFLFASIPMKEKRLLASRKDFARYKEEVSVLIPLPPKS